MSLKKALVYIFFVLSIAGCSALEAYFESSSITFVTPIDGQRFTDLPVAEQPVYVSLVLKLVSDRKEFKTVRIYFNDLGPIPCDLTPDVEKDCGAIPLEVRGTQTLRVDMDIMNGSEVFRTQSYSSSFLWTPYDSWWDLSAIKLAQLFHKEEPSSGYKVFAFITAAILLILGYFVSRRSVKVSFVVGWSGLVLFIFIYSLSGSLIAHSVAWVLFFYAIFFGLCGLVADSWMKSYERRQHTVVLPKVVFREDDDTGDNDKDDTIDAKATLVGEYLPAPKPHDPTILS